MSPHSRPKGQLYPKGSSTRRVSGSPHSRTSPTSANAHQERRGIFSLGRRCKTLFECDCCLILESPHRPGGEYVNLLIIDMPNPTYGHLSSLSPMQQQILALLYFPVEIYTQLAPEMVKPPQGELVSESKLRTALIFLTSEKMSEL